MELTVQVIIIRMKIQVRDNKVMDLYLNYNKKVSYQYQIDVTGGYTGFQRL
jgi:hypothetical protein